MKKIIIPLDFSIHSEYALKAAALIAKKHDAELFALHMLELSSSLLNESEREQQTKAIFYLKLAEKNLEDFLDKNYLQGIKITPMVKHYKVFSELNEVSKDIQADLIVMGSKGVSGMKEILIGSNTEKVVRNSEIPVLVVKKELKDINFENVIFASNFSDETATAYAKASKLLTAFESNIHLVFVNVPGEQFKTSAEMEEMMMRFLEKVNGDLSRLRKVHYVADISVEKGILNFAHKIHANLIVIPTHGRKGLAHFFEGSISEDLANHSDFPVMTFKI